MAITKLMPEMLEVLEYQVECKTTAKILYVA